MKFPSPQKLTRDGIAQRAVTTTTKVIKPKPWIFKGSSSLPMIKEHEMVEKPKEDDKGFWQESVLLEKLVNKFFHNSGIETTHTQKQISVQKDPRPMVLNEVQSLRIEDGQNDWDDFFLDLNYWDVMSPNCGRIKEDISQGYEAS
ncbi:hypothetical protein Nepgr_031661 [Nepenthes gracilis]|uniref:Uncharacterized protein n=1 Tax=Nepenthes gracilis TaxID=150966 RepID=A0AAD3Y5B6_NEPGR|nr:hypothetical protein Nepgr_031661 [Nepenthes gracilis]